MINQESLNVEINKINNFKKMENQRKLDEILKKREQKMQSVHNFHEYFEKFAFYNLRKVVEKIDFELNVRTGESLRYFNENPYEKINTRFFVMVQLLTNSYRRNNFYLDNTENFPLIKFEGDEFRGVVVETISLGKQLIRNKEYQISQLNSEEFVFEIIVNFLEVIYNH